MSPQKENGFTPIANELFEAFYRCKLTEYERCIVMCIWRKTYGWSKSDDWVSNTQLQEETGIALPNITRTLNLLKKKNIIQKNGKRVGVNKRYLEWKVDWRKVISPDNKVISPDNKKLSHQIPTKEKKETNTKAIREKGVDNHKKEDLKTATVEDMKEFNPQGAEVIYELIKVDPKNKTYYGNKTQRAACDFLLAEYGLDEIKKRTDILPKTNGIQFFPNITTPCQLRDKWVQLDNQIKRHKAENDTKSNNVIW
jgi:phage replication O-like protein O